MAVIRFEESGSVSKWNCAFAIRHVTQGVLLAIAKRAPYSSRPSYTVYRLFQLFGKLKPLP